MTQGSASRRTQCCIAGGGPAGMMLGFLLARSGVDVIVLEKHRDFFRDFRGDTIHPSTLEVMFELGLLDEFLKVPHQEIRRLSGQIGDTSITIADFSHLPTRCKFLALMPQWDFLNFLAERARRYSGFHLEMETQAVDLLGDGDRITGVRALTNAGTIDIHADLVVASDGRSSTIREKAGLRVEELGAPMDILWFRMDRLPSDPGQALGRIDFGKILVMIDRASYWQCGYVIAKGAFEHIQARGMDAFRKDIALLAPFMGARLDELRDWNDVKILTVAVNRLSTWYRPGLLCIGDAAHAMSPIGGVGINLALQDAIATANVIAEPLGRGRLTLRDLAAVQRRRLFPTRVIQTLQILIQSRIIGRVLGSSAHMSPPWPMRLLGRFPYLQRIPARLVGLGVRPEHVRTPALR